MHGAECPVPGAHLPSAHALLSFLLLTSYFLLLTSYILLPANCQQIGIPPLKKKLPGKRYRGANLKK